MQFMERKKIKIKKKNKNKKNKKKIKKIKKKIKKNYFFPYPIDSKSEGKRYFATKI